VKKRANQRNPLLPWTLATIAGWILKQPDFRVDIWVPAEPADFLDVGVRLPGNPDRFTVRVPIGSPEEEVLQSLDLTAARARGKSGSPVAGGNQPKAQTGAGKARRRPRSPDQS
jgi:hypothetical protein